MESKTSLLVSKIREGTVIDHIPAGKALKVLRILGISGGEPYRIAVVMNAESRKLGRKDIVKIEGKFLSKRELDLIALVAPTATINIVKNYSVVEKYKVSIPSEVKGLLTCPNPSCITRKEREVAVSWFKLVSSSPVVLECMYCGTRISGEDVEKHIKA